MTSTPPEQPDHNEPTVPLEGGQPDYGRAAQPPPPPPGHLPPPPPGYGPPPGYQPPPGGYSPPPGAAYGAHAGAPWGVHPVTGVPYSDKQKLIAGLLNILLPFGIGRFYIGDTGTGVAQLLVTILTCGIGSLWSFIDGILMLTGDPNDSQGRPLRP
ncbi:TM2 domain-containing protein [Aeromicrobium sp. NPDC092404]|uniref:TM2 domain-containing protein n=1 Tax=Aeromicrobium sp. NPDC092404 TaxID=3154976 RepID=UPI003437AE4D